MYTSVRRILRQYKSGKIKPKEIKLFAPKVLATASNDNRFTLVRHNALDPLPRKYNVVRAMNLLNTSYFSPEQFRAIAKNIYNGLFDEGLFITGSNQEAGSVVDGGIYIRTENGFKNIYKSGKGSPVDAIITGE
jgi:hypothetical protein